MFKFSYSDEMVDGIEVTAENTTTATYVFDVVEAFENFLRGCGMLPEGEHIEIVADESDNYDTETATEPETDTKPDTESEEYHAAYDAGYDHGMADVEELRRVVADTGHDVTPYLEGYAAAISDNA